MDTNDQYQDQVRVTKPYEGITVITIDRAHRRNAVDAATAHKLYAAVTAFEDDDSQKVSWVVDRERGLQTKPDHHPCRICMVLRDSATNVKLINDRSQSFMEPTAHSALVLTYTL